MYGYERLWTFNTRNFQVVLEWTPEDFPDVSDDEVETIEKLNSGEWTNACFRVRVLYRGAEIGSNYLGNSIYENVADFRDHVGLGAKSRADGVKYDSYFMDMVSEAIHEARKSFRDMPRLRRVA